MPGYERERVPGYEHETGSLSYTGLASLAQSVRRYLVITPNRPRLARAVGALPLTIPNPNPNASLAQLPI